MDCFDSHKTSSSRNRPEWDGIPPSAPFIYRPAFLGPWSSDFSKHNFLFNPSCFLCKMSLFVGAYLELFNTTIIHMGYFLDENYNISIVYLLMTVHHINSLFDDDEHFHNLLIDGWRNGLLLWSIHWGWYDISIDYSLTTVQNFLSLYTDDGTTNP